MIRESFILFLDRAKELGHIDDKKYEKYSDEFMDLFNENQGLAINYANKVIDKVMKKVRGG